MKKTVRKKKAKKKKAKKKSVKLPITLCTVTRNAGKRLGKLVKHCREYVSEIILFDQSSTDGSWEKAQELADIAIKRRNKGAADPDRNLIFELASQPWILYLDDDEYLDDGLVKALPELLNDAYVDIYWIKTINLVDGVNISEVFGKGEDPHARIFRKGKIFYEDQETNLDHTYPKVIGEANVAYLNHYLVHDRELKKLVESNERRNKIATPQQREMQNGFIKSVQDYLEKNKHKK